MRDKNLFLKTLLLFLGVFIGNFLFAQNVAVNATGEKADNSAILDVKHANKGMLVPRVSLMDNNDKATIPAPANSLLVYNINEDMIKGEGKGYYYNSGTATDPTWLKLATATTASKAWLINGNDDIIAGLHFVGTNNDQDVVVKQNGVEGLRVMKGGTLLVTGDPATGTVPTLPNGFGMLWLPSKTAFRAGVDNSDNWSNDNVGYQSIATGYNSMASGNVSVAMGESNKANGTASVTLGKYNQSSAEGAVAVGIDNKASGLSSLAGGYYTQAAAEAAISLGYKAIAKGKYSVALGNGSVASSLNSTAMGESTSAWGLVSTAIGYKSTATGDTSIAIGNTNNALGDNSIAMGKKTLSSGVNSTTMGYSTKATALYATALGNTTTASGIGSTSLGTGTTASGSNAIAMGNFTTASAVNSTAMGKGTDASADAATAMGTETNASGNSSTSIGYRTNAIGNRSFASGANTTASGTGSITMGTGTTASGNYSFAAGSGAKATGEVAIALGSSTADGDYSLAAGNGSKTTNSNAIALGNQVLASGVNAVALGSGAKATAEAAIALGNQTSANAKASVAINALTTALGENSVAMGFLSKATGNSSIAAGEATNALGKTSFTMGYSTQADKDYGVALGYDTRAFGYGSFAMGRGTVAEARFSTAVGLYNDLFGAPNPDVSSETDKIFEVGAGDDNDNRRNALTVLKKGRTGINTFPSATLHLKARETDFLDNGGDLNGYGIIVESPSSKKLTLRFVADKYFRIGIGNNQTVASFSSNGDNNADGGTLFVKNIFADKVTAEITDISDLRLKKNIEPLYNVLEKINRIQPILFNYNKVANRPEKDRYIGFSAQEVEKQFPELVRQNQNGYLSVNYANMSAVLLQAIKEQQEIINNLTQRLNEKEKENTEFKNQIQQVVERLNKLEQK